MVLGNANANSNFHAAACEVEVFMHYLLGRDTSNKPLEWTGRHHFPARAIQLLPATQGQRSKDQEAVESSLSKFCCQFQNHDMIVRCKE
jgi:hypothetical protein